MRPKIMQVKRRLSAQTAGCPANDKQELERAVTRPLEMPHRKKNILQEELIAYRPFSLDASRDSTGCSGSVAALLLRNSRIFSFGLIADIKFSNGRIGRSIQAGNSASGSAGPLQALLQYLVQALTRLRGRELRIAVPYQADDKLLPGICANDVEETRVARDIARGPLGADTSFPQV